MPLPHPYATNFEVALDQIRQEVGLPPQACPAEVVVKVRELAAKSLPGTRREPCGRCGGGGWVPSNTDTDTDPCPECEGGFAR
jgi:hypothetical protein